jgi:EAL domain-containing protein (putative c-di-GMP-specific phosphodiesterase class I)/CHASE2 domain-containing sensor protein
MPSLRQLLASRWRVRPRPLILGAGALAGLAVLFTGAGAGLERQLTELRYGLRSHAASGAVHIVEVDARSLSQIGRWPLPRSIHARAIDRLRESGARSIAFDVDFSAASTAREDAALAAALERAGGSVVVPTFRQAAGGASSQLFDSVPIKLFSERAFLAGVNVHPDADGYVRRMPLGIETAGTPRPSLPSLVAESVAEIGTEFAVDYAIEPDSIPRHSLVDLVRGKVPAEAIAGKRVIIGATAIEMGDRYSVPRHGVIPGVVVQALAAETLLQGPVPRDWGGALPLAALLLLALAAIRPAPDRRHLALFGAGVLALLALPLASEQLFAVSLDLAPALAAAGVMLSVAGMAVAARRARRREATDGETGLPNLVALEAALADRADARLVVAQIDHFAMIGSGIGAAATAKLILRVAERLKLGCGDAAIYRTGSATLAWIEGDAEESRLEAGIDAVAALMRAPVECGRLVDVSLSFGVAAGAGAGARQLAANGALAATRASRSGARWQAFTEEDEAEADWQLSLIAELDSAMASGALWVAYQPKVDVASGETIGVEALVRWNHPVRGPIGPDRFIPLIEEHGRAGDLTRYVFRQALADAQRWEAQGSPIGVAVNVSATLLADRGFIDWLRETLASGGVVPARVTIEVTESAAMRDPERAVAALESWRALGVGISIDDYGTGQSSLAYLQTLPATELKIDKSFVQAMESERRNAIMVRSTIALAHELGMKVVAEGIEDSACLRMLAEMGCDTAQGYHLGRPMAAEAVTALLETRMQAAA